MKRIKRMRPIPINNATIAITIPTIAEIQTTLINQIQNKNERERERERERLNTSFSAETQRLERTNIPYHRPTPFFSTTINHIIFV
jgi:hypothetical protein